MVPDTTATAAAMGVSMAKPSVPPPSSAMPPLISSVRPVPVPVVPQPNGKDEDKMKDDSAPAGQPESKKEEVSAPAPVPAPVPVVQPAPTAEAAKKEEGPGTGAAVIKDDSPAPPAPVPPAPPAPAAPAPGIKEDGQPSNGAPAPPAPAPALGNKEDKKEEVQPSNGNTGAKAEKASDAAGPEEGKAKGGLQLLASLAPPVGPRAPMPGAFTPGPAMPGMPMPGSAMPHFMVPPPGSVMPPLMVPPHGAPMMQHHHASPMPPLTTPGAVPPLAAPGAVPPLLDPKNPNAAAIAIIQNDNKNKKKKSRMEEMDPKDKIFVEKVSEVDVLCGRGGKSNHHPGNKRYRQVVSEMKRTYRSTGAKTAKTDLSRAIVEHVLAYGGRFIKRDEGTGQYFLLTKAQARRKTSQALRETKELKWTMEQKTRGSFGVTRHF